MVYLITDRRLFGTTEDLYRAIGEALRAGIRRVQLREKGLTDRELLSMAYRMKDLTTKYNAELFINDRADIALIVNAEGVHLGQASMPADVVRGIVKGQMQIGVSTHSLDEALTAQRRGADFITFGPVFYTPSKAGYGEPLGLQRLKEVTKLIELPVYAIGGIKADNLLDVLKAGAKGIALITGILSASDVYSETKRYLELLGEPR